ncbi:YrdB family protein [Streptomyces sp. NPDC060194]|uniref:YrdB family protein n=1 Tax=Streptomyces sp. NPDC060194 TaxID=3347069 RepID=UPI0036660D78
MRLAGPLHAINEGLAFVLELIAFAALARWGWASVDATALALLLAVAAPGAAIVLWGAFAAPRARVPLPLAGVLAVKAVVFGAAALALLAVGRPAWALGFAVVVTVNTLLATLDRTARPELPGRVARGS